MALQSSGTITVEDIYTELGNSNIGLSGGVALSSLETGGFGNINTNSTNKPDGSTPYAMSEWYGYDHNAASQTLTSYNSTINPQLSAFNACGDKTSITYYHDGLKADPLVGDTLYSDSAGNNSLAAGYYQLSSLGSWVLTNSSGTITSAGGCRSERRLKKNIEYIGISPMGIPIYHFEYKNSEHAPNGKGRYVGTMADELQKLGFLDVLFTKDGDVWVDYNKLDIDCKLV